MVLSPADATAINNHYEITGQLKTYFQSINFITMTVKSVPLPEDNSRKRDWSVEVTLLRQHVNIASVHALNGRMQFR